MSQIELLKKFTLKENLIKDVSDIDFLFLSYEYDNSESLEKLINKVIEWGFNNDELEDFYSEHWDELLNSDNLTLIQGCKIEDTPYVTTFDLYRYNSKNMYYYRVESFGLYSDNFDTSGFYTILDNQDDDLIINSFKQECMGVFNNFGELSTEDLKSSKIEFYN
tara:strand:+ start:905 stop:1396 length:492 start_codon:yes stop_codon:yes gene_type:complete